MIGVYRWYVLGFKHREEETITDFAADDAFIIGGGGFGLTADANGANGPAEWAGAKQLKAEYFTETGTVATLAHAQFIFDDETDGAHHILYFDVDGTGAQTKIAIIDLLTADLDVTQIGLFV